VVTEVIVSRSTKRITDQSIPLSQPNHGAYCDYHKFLSRHKMPGETRLTIAMGVSRNSTLTLQLACPIAMPSLDFPPKETAVPLWGAATDIREAWTTASEELMRAHTCTGSMIELFRTCLEITSQNCRCIFNSSQSYSLRHKTACVEMNENAYSC
jgi:hypothetical protein